LPHPVYCKDGASDSFPACPRKNPIKSAVPAATQAFVALTIENFAQFLHDPGRRFFSLTAVSASPRAPNRRRGVEKISKSRGPGDPRRSTPGTEKLIRRAGSITIARGKNQGHHPRKLMSFGANHEVYSKFGSGIRVPIAQDCKTTGESRIAEMALFHFPFSV
jgi:hypothetical protein